MSSPEKGYNINQTFIIETQADDGVLSACTALFTTNIYSCSGNTQILLGNTSISTVGDLFVGGDLSATTISATTFYGDGSNLTGISTQDTFVTGGTYSAGTAVFTNNTGGTFSVTGFSTSNATEFTGGTVTGATNFTGGLTANTISATTYQNLPIDVRVTGGTYSNGTAVFTNNTGGTFSVSGFSSGVTDVFVTGATYGNNTFIFTNNTGGTFNTSFDVVTGFTVNGGLTATTLNGNGSNISGINFSQLATTAHTHPISEVINLQNQLDSKIEKPANPFLGDYLYYNGITWVPNQVNIPVAAGAGVTLFLSITGSSLPTYEYLSQFPIEITESQEPVTVNSNQVLIGKYATEQLNRTVVDAGIWEFNTYASVDIPSSGLTQIIVNAYLLSTAGTETFLFSSATENITTTAATVYTISVVEPQYSCSTSDYLVVNYSASTTNNFNTTVTLYHGGNVNYSHIHTPFVTLHNDLAGIQGGFSNEHYHLSKNEAELLTTGLDASSIHNHNSLYFGLGGGTITGNTEVAGSFSASTYLGLPIDVFTTGATYNNANQITFTNNTGGTFDVSFNFFTGITATTISANTFSNTQFYDLYNDLPSTGESTTIYIVGQSSAYVYDTTINDYVLLNSPTPNNTPELGEVFFVDLATQSTLISCVYYNGPSNDGIGARLTGTTNEAIRETLMASNSGRIDSVVVQSGDTILVKNQSSSLQNGIYQVLQVGSPSQPFIIERISGYDQTSEIYPSQVNVISGSNNGNKSFFEIIENPVIGFSAITYGLNTTTSSQILPTIFVDTVTSSALPNNPVYVSGTTLPSLPSYLAELSATTNGAFPTINGVSPFVNMRILVKNQASANQNGDYVLISLGSASSRWRLRRLTYGWSSTNYLVREWEVNRSSSTEFGSRYSLSALTGTQSISNANWGNTGNLNFIQNNTEITGVTYNANTISINRNKGLSSLTTNINSFTGLTINGGLTATTISATTISGGTLYGDGSNLTGISSSSGIFGITNSAGTYTFYSTLTLAMAAATSGQTIEMFANVTETGAVTITLKSDVVINGNGYTYTLNNTGSTNAFQVTSSGNYTIRNLILTRTGSTITTSYQNLCVYVNANSVTCNLEGSILRGQKSCFSTQALITNFVLIGGSYYSGAIAVLAYGPVASANYAYVDNIYCESTATDGSSAISLTYAEGNRLSARQLAASGGGFGIRADVSNVRNSYGYSFSSHGISTFSAAELRLSTGESSSGRGISGGGTISNCVGKSNTGVGLYNEGVTYNSVGISNTTFGFYPYINAPAYNCVGISTSSWGIVGYNNNIFNCHSTSTSNVALSMGGGYATTRFIGCTFTSNWNSASGHAVAIGNNIMEFDGCTFIVTNTSANCINNSAAPSAITVRYTKSTFINSTTSVSATITQGVTNTSDNQGNLIIN